MKKKSVRLPPSYESLVQAFQIAVTNFKSSDLVSKLIAEESARILSARIKDAYALHTGKNGARNIQRRRKVGNRRNQLELALHVARLASMHEFAV